MCKAESRNYHLLKNNLLEKLENHSPSYVAIVSSCKQTYKPRYFLLLGQNV